MATERLSDENVGSRNRVARDLGSHTHAVCKQGVYCRPLLPGALGFILSPFVLSVSFVGLPTDTVLTRFQSHLEFGVARSGQE